MAEEITKPPEMLEADRLADSVLRNEFSLVMLTQEERFLIWCVVRNAFLMGRGYGIKQERDRK